MKANIHDRARQLVAQGACVTASEAYSMLAKRRAKEKAPRPPQSATKPAAKYWWQLN